MIRRIARFLLRREMGELRAQANESAYLRAERDGALAVVALRQSEVDALQKRALRPDPTPAEARMLDIVRGNPGLIASEFGLLAHKADCDERRAKHIADTGADVASAWWNRPAERGSYLIAEASRPLTTLHKKSLVRREKAGNTYRYWSVE